MNSEFEIKDIDKEGIEILDAISAAGKFNQWMFKTIQPYCHGRILEIGSGIGNISDFFIQENADIRLSDLRENYLEMLRKKYAGKNLGFHRIDLVHPEFEKEYAEIIGTFDTVFALNVVEHIKDDQQAIENCYKLLKPGGTIIILVPAFQSLYTPIDESLYHYRRYTKKSLNALISKFFTVEKSKYFNVMGIAGWFLYGKILRRRTIKSDQTKIFNAMFPVPKIFDAMFRRWFGLSVISVGRKNK